MPDGAESDSLGQRMHDLARRLWPLNRSITGEGTRQTLRILREICPAMTLHEAPSGTAAFDWTVPDEWNVRAAYIVGPDGERFCDFAENNLHLVGYSVPVDEEMDLAALQGHLYSLPDQPDAIPYVTSYYARRWGFCLTQRARDALKPGSYRAVIDATLAPGALTYGEILLPGASAREVLISTYVCHPSMANNELSGPCVSIHLAAWLAGLPARRCTYRFVYGAETIGSLTYLSRHLDHLKQHVIAGFNLSCLGDERAYSYLPSRAENTLADRAALHALTHVAPGFTRYGWADRGSDERQYCAPGIDLPVASIMRSKYGAYPEYHTSLDDLSLVTPAGLEGGFTALKRAIETIEADCRPRMNVLGEPQLGKRGLYPTISTKESGATVRTMMNLITYCDGTRTLLEIAEKIGAPAWELRPILDRLAAHDLVEIGEA
jgi:aminopeptidase-like protein